MVREMKGTPQQPVPGHQSIQIPIKVNFDDADEDDADPTVGPKRDGRTGIRRARITKCTLKEAGYTEDCAGCAYMRAGMGERRGHNEACRKNVEEWCRQTEEGRAIMQREAERRERTRRGGNEEQHDIEMEGCQATRSKEKPGEEAQRKERAEGEETRRNDEGRGMEDEDEDKGRRREDDSLELPWGPELRIIRNTGSMQQ